MKKIALIALSLTLALSLCPVIGVAADVERDYLPSVSGIPANGPADQPSEETPLDSASANVPKPDAPSEDDEGPGSNAGADEASGETVVTAPNRALGHIENVTDPNNYLSADFVMPADYFAEDVLPADALNAVNNGKDVDLWLESTRGVSQSDTELILGKLDGYLPVTYFGLSFYWQVDGGTSVKGPAETNGDRNVRISLKLPDSATGTDPTITREFKVICAYDDTASVLPCSYDASSHTLEFRTNRFASFGIACKSTRDGKAVYPVAVRNSYAQESGQGEYAVGDTVIVNAGERDGYMVDLWSAVPADKVVCTPIDSSHASFVMPASPVQVILTWIPIGSITDTTNASDNALNATLLDKGVNLAQKVLSNDAMRELEAMNDVDIWLTSANGISDADAQVVAANLGGRTLVSEVDLSLFYKINGNETQVHETNAPVAIRLALPPSTADPSASTARTYEVIRVHAGKADVLPAAFDGSAGTLTFETDRFSAYAVVYKDTAAGAPSEGGNSENAAGKLSATGDDMGASVALCLGAIACALVLICVSSRKALPTRKGKHAAR